MSASSKKKLRNAQNADKMTERQLHEQKEAKKLKIYTTIFTVVLVAIFGIAIFAAGSKYISNSGIREKNTVAVTIDEHELSNAEFNYYFIDAVNNFYQNYGSYAALFGLDVTQPLDEQVIDEEGTTWADDFASSAKDSAAATYALADAAEAAGHTLTEAEQESIDTALMNMKAYALMYGYGDLDSYLKAIYGQGASEEGYRAYYTINTLATSYYNAYSDGLTYDAAALKAAYDEAPAEYTAYSYNSYYINATNYREGGTEDEEGNVTYSDEEKAAAVEAAEADAKALAEAEITTAEELDAAIAALAINADAETAPTSSSYVDSAYSNISSVIQEWVTDASRKAGDLTYIANTSTSTDEEGNETTTTNGYYVVLFNSSNDNSFALKNVRHILVSYEGGTYDSTTGTTTYSDAEKAAAKEKAEEILAQWMAGEATEESFAALANEKSADGDGTTGGLYEDIYPGQMVEKFDAWCYDESRKTGDTGIVESTYGYHVMYFVADSETNYRDFMVENTLRSHDTEHWYTELIEAIVVTDGDLSYISKDLVLSNG